MADELSFKDPKKQQPLVVTTVPKGDLEVIRHQRKPRAAHLKQLGASIERIGFVTPLVVVKRDGRYVIIDGQHRFQAGTEAGVKEFPVVVVPEALARKMMSLNVEKDLNIRERCQIALSIYRESLESTPDLAEDDGELIDSVEWAHYITLGLAYERQGRLAGSSFEPMLKKCDGFLKDPLSKACEIREGRADRVVEAHKLTKKVADSLKESGRWHSFVGQQIMAYANPLKRARKLAEFDKTFDRLIAKLEDLVEHPEKVLGQSVD